MLTNNTSTTLTCVEESSPAISIIMPVWNGMPYLQKAVQSVLDQKFQNWELLVRDDGSTDASTELLAGLTDPRIRILEAGANLGIFGNLNKLFAEARSPISQLLCQDDYLSSPDALGEIVSTWSIMPEHIGFMRCNAEVIGTKWPFERQARRLIPAVIDPAEAELYFFLFGCIPGNLSNVSIRTDLVEQAGWFDQRMPYAGDFQFWIRASRYCSFFSSPKTWVFVRQHFGQASSHLNRHGELIPQLYMLIATLYDRLKEVHDPFWLKTFATIAYDAQHRWIGVKHLARSRDQKYLNAVDTEANSCSALHRSWLRWILFFSSLKGRIGGISIARRLLLNSQKSKRNISSNFDNKAAAE